MRGLHPLQSPAWRTPRTKEREVSHVVRRSEKRNRNHQRADTRFAEDWFNRCGFERDDKRTLLWHLLEQNADLENFIELYEENEEYKSHPEEFEEQREEYEMEPGDTFDFEDELQYWLDDWKLSKLSMAEEVEAIRDYVEALRKFKGE